jgi:hypothetical protein
MGFTYRPRESHKTVLYETVRDYLEEFLEDCRIDGKTLPAYIEKQFRGYLRCGILQFGFVRRICEQVLTHTCTHTILTPFSCKFTGFCPSCCGRRMAEAALHLVDNVLPYQAMRQWVVSLPFPLRYIAATNKEIQTKIHSIIMNEIHHYYIKKSKINSAKTGSITSMQRWPPLGAHADDKTFKPVFIDIGLMQRCCGRSVQQIMEVDDLVSGFKGQLAEQFVGQQLLARGSGCKNGGLYYWRRMEKSSTAEVDYLLARNNQIIPFLSTATTQAAIFSSATWKTKFLPPM